MSTSQAQQTQKPKGILTSQNVRNNMLQSGGQSPRLTDTTNIQIKRIKDSKDSKDMKDIKDIKTMINDNKQNKESSDVNNMMKDNVHEVENVSTLTQKPYEFQIGLQVGVALGECHLQLQKLDNSIQHLSTVSDDIQDVMLYLKDSIEKEKEKDKGKEKNLTNVDTSSLNSHPNSTNSDIKKKDTNDNNKENKRNSETSVMNKGLISNANSSLNDKQQQNSQSRDKIRKLKNFDSQEESSSAILSPFDEVSILNSNLEKWQMDTNKRRKDLVKSINSLQTKLEDLDTFCAKKKSITQPSQTDLNDAYTKIAQLQGELHQAKIDINNATFKMTQVKHDLGDKEKELEERTKKLEEREKGLDRDAEIIAAQSDELRKESERLLKERDDVRKQKEQWQQLLEEQKEQKNKIEQQNNEFQMNQRKLLALQTQIEEEKLKIAKRKKKLKSREKRANLIRNQQSGGVNNNSNDDNQSELTYFSDGDTEVASVNSISDDENNDPKIANHKPLPISHLLIPQNSF